MLFHYFFEQICRTICVDDLLGRTGEALEQRGDSAEVLADFVRAVPVGVDAEEDLCFFVLFFI